MSTSNSPLAYDDIRDALDRALSADHGVRIHSASVGAAMHLKQRLYKFRKIDRDQSRKLFPEDDSRHGTSIFDSLTVEQIDTILVIKRRVAGALQIEDIEP